MIHTFTSTLAKKSMPIRLLSVMIHLFYILWPTLTNELFSWLGFHGLQILSFTYMFIMLQPLTQLLYIELGIEHYLCHLL